MDFAVLHYAHLARFFGVARAVHNILVVTAVDFADNLINSRQNLLNKVLVPLFKSLCHNRVVGVSKCIGDDMPRLLPSVAALVEQNSHQLGNCESGVSVVDVDSNLLVEVIHTAVNTHMAHDDITDRGSAHKILLTQTESLTFCVVVVRIEHL